ncbi:MAG: putative membrane protein [Verrucomicrobiales bacterium]|jgi:uncharacterized membrane protein
MKIRILHLWEKMRTSFWFIPGFTVACFMAAGFTMLEVDERWRSDLLAEVPALHDVSPGGLRSLLSTAGTAVLALAGVTFSGALVALTLASGQFGSRLLRNFIRALPNQIALGVQLGTFVMCLIILRSVRDFNDGSFLPHLSAFMAFLATVASLGTFIYFIHHISTSLQAERIVGNVFKDLDETIEHRFPDGISTDREEDEAETTREMWGESDDEHRVASDVTGYLQAINIEGLVELTRELGSGVCGRVLAHPGKFIVEGEALVAIRGGVPDEEDPWRNCFITGMERTPEQDFEQHIRQLVETGLRALSPGINDPFTAIHCIDYLGAALAKVARRRLPTNEHLDEDGNARILTRPISFDSMMATAFNQLRQASRGKPDIAMRLLETFASIARASETKEARKAIRQHADLVGNISESEELAEPDLDCIRMRLETVRKLTE